jgi:hypothetical protein
VPKDNNRVKKYEIELDGKRYTAYQPKGEGVVWFSLPDTFRRNGTYIIVTAIDSAGNKTSGTRLK